MTNTPKLSPAQVEVLRALHGSIDSAPARVPVGMATRLAELGLVTISAGERSRMLHYPEQTKLSVARMGGVFVSLTDRGRDTADAIVALPRPARPWPRTLNRLPPKRSR